METKKPKRMYEGQRASIRSLLDGPGKAPFSDGRVRILLDDGDAVRAELEAMERARDRAQAEALDMKGLVRTWQGQANRIMETADNAQRAMDVMRSELEALRAELEQCKVDRDSYRHAMESASEDARRRWRILSVLADVMGAPAGTEAESLPNVLRERLGQRPAVDATSPALRACVPVPAEPELTPEERERLGRLAYTERLAEASLPDVAWESVQPASRALWCRAGVALYREGYRAAMARVREVVEAVKPIDGESATSLGATHEAWRAGCVWVLDFMRKNLAQPPAKPNAEPAPTWPPPMDTFWTHKQHGGKWRVYWLHWQNPHNGGDGSVELSGTHSDGMGGREVVERARFETEWRPWHEAEASTTAHAPTQDATEALHTRQRAACRSDHRPGLTGSPPCTCALWPDGNASSSQPATLDERVGWLEAEGARVREQAARTEHALREVVEWLARINRPALSLVPEVVRARRALGMPETP